MSEHVTVKDNHFTLHAKSASYSFHVAPSGDLIHDHFGGYLNSSSCPLPSAPKIPDGGWLQGPSDSYGRAQREFPDNGNGDFGLPAVRIRHSDGTTVTRFRFLSYDVSKGKPRLDGLPATFGQEEEVSTLNIELRDEVSLIDATLSYSVFPKHNAIARSFKIYNGGEKNIVVQAAASFSVDLPHAAEGRDIVQLSGEWARETQIIKRPIYPGFQGHLHNPFLCVAAPTTSETSGIAYGFSLVYSGSFSASVERGPTGLDRVQIGMNPLQLDWVVGPGRMFQSPEGIAVYSSKGLGEMSRSYHRLYRDHLSRSSWTYKDRPVLINNWEATYFDFDQDKIYTIAKQASEVGCSLAVLDDGWFGTKYPRNDDDAGLGDWHVNENKLQGGLDALVKRIGQLKNAEGNSMKFGLWVEPEHVNPKSELYESHPGWALHATSDNREYPRIVQRNQQILDLSMSEVQDHLIKVLSDLLGSTDIAYVKWDCNKAIEQLPNPSIGHAYILGLYRVVDTLTHRFPDILWEGCASGGGRFDPGLLHYWPGSWTSDCTDPVDRLHIQTGTSLVYPASSMSGHVSASPNHQTGRETPLEFRAHVAMICGSFGFELDPGSFTQEEKDTIPALIRLSKRVSPLTIKGDLYRLARPDESNWPAFEYVGGDGDDVVVLAFQLYNRINTSIPPVRLQGLESGAVYVDGEGIEWHGDMLMSVGLMLPWKGDYQSKVLFFKRTSKVDQPK